MLLIVCIGIACVFAACRKKVGDNTPKDTTINEDGKVETMVREKINFNTGWLYSPKDYTNGELVGLNDAGFEQVSIPHANTLLTTHKGPDFQEQIESYRFVSWYRRHFVLDENYEGKRIIIEFEGVATVAEVYVNEQYVGEHKGAYTSFSFDITEFLKPCGEENVIAVRVDSTRQADIPPEGGSVDYCLFGGIVRDVWMIATGECYIDNTFTTTPDIETGSGKVNNASTVKNGTGVEKELTVETCLLDKEGNMVSKGSATAVVAAGASHTFITETDTMENPILWDTENPYLYTVVTRVFDGDICIDDYETRLGFRWFEFTDDGFYLNGKKIELIGVNRHEQWAYLGRAVNNKHQMADADLIKETGFNAVRCSHYPQDPAFLERCDEIGLIVFEEAPGWQYIGDEEWKEVYITNIQEMIVRDRNHPSIVSWGTRVNESFDDDVLYTETNKIAKELDATRPTHGVRRMESYVDSVFLEGEDIYTVNYRYPDVPKYKPFIITEHSMDWYNGNGFSWATDTKALEFTKSFASVVDYYFGNEYCLGGFVWSMFDYNNEVNYTKTDNVFYSGMYDIFRIEKMPAFFYMSQKDKEEAPMVYIANYWTKESSDTVTIMSNCDEIELLVNGRSVGKSTPNLYMNLPHPMYEFKNITFEAGEITAIGYVDGKEVARHTRKTPQAPARLILTPDYASIVADGSDFTSVKITLVDENGTILPYADSEVTVTVTGAGRFIGEEKLNLEGGSGAFYVASNYLETGVVQCSVSADGVESAACEITVAEYTGTTVPIVKSNGMTEGICVNRIDVNDTNIGTSLNHFIYSGSGWDSAAQPGCYYADNHFSKAGGDTCTFSFVGSSFKLYASTAPSHGIMKLSVDGGEEQIIDCYSEVRKDGIEVFDSGELEEKEHTVTITVTGRKNAKATDSYVNVDNISFISSSNISYKEEDYSMPADVIWSDGYANQGSVYEWAVSRAPQCAYVGTVDFDNLSSVILRFGHEWNVATLSLYAYDHGGKELTREELNWLARNKELLGESIATINSGKIQAWGYQTVEISRDGIAIAEGDGYFTLEDGSKRLEIPAGTGEKALILYVDGNIGSLAYFDYVKLLFQ